MASLARPALFRQPAAGGDDLAAQVQAAQEELARAIQVGGLTNDPLRHVLAAQSTLLGVMAATARQDAVLRRLDDLGAKLDRMPRRVGFSPASPRFDRMLAMAAVISSMSLIVVGAGLFSGRLHRSGVAPEWRRVAELNDYAATPKNCAQQNGRMACAMTVYVGE